MMDVREKPSNKKRLIDANAFLKDILTAGIGKTIIEYSESDIGYMIRERPTVDAVEVVRCRECKYHNKPPCPMRLSFNWTEDDDFCSYGDPEGE